MNNVQLYTIGDYCFGSVIFNKFTHILNTHVTRIYSDDGIDLKFQYSSLTGEIIVIDTNKHSIINVEYTY